jgi:hypothetical protein
VRAPVFKASKGDRMSKNKNQPVNKEAFKMLSMEIGLNAACRKLGVPIPTGKSWARRGKWKLPKRKGGRPGRTLPSSNASSLHPIADALDATSKKRELATRSQLEQAAQNWALAAAQAQPQVPTATAFAAVMTGIAKLFGWDRPGQTLTINSDKTVIVCDEGRRTELIAQRQRLLEAEAEKPVPGRTVDVLTAASQEAQSKANVGARSGTVAQDQKPTVQQDPFYRHMEAIGKGESLRTGKGSEQMNEPPVMTDYMPWPEEYQ